MQGAIADRLIRGSICFGLELSGATVRAPEDRAKCWRQADSQPAVGLVLAGGGAVLAPTAVERGWCRKQCNRLILGTVVPESHAPTNPWFRGLAVASSKHYHGYEVRYEYSYVVRARYHSNQ